MRGDLWPSIAVSAWCAGALHRGLSLKGLPIKLNCCQQSTDLYLFSSLISIPNRPFRCLATADCAAVCLFGFLKRNLLSTGQAHPLLVSKAYNCHCLPWSTNRSTLHRCEVSWRLWMQVQPCVFWSAFLQFPLTVEKKQEMRSSKGLVPWSSSKCIALCRLFSSPPMISPKHQRNVGPAKETPYCAEWDTIYHRSEYTPHIFCKYCIISCLVTTLKKWLFATM